MSNCLAVIVVWHWGDPEDQYNSLLHLISQAKRADGWCAGLQVSKYHQVSRLFWDFECKDHKVALFQTGLGRWERFCQNISRFWSGLSWQGQLCLSLIPLWRSAQIMMNNYRSKVKLLHWSFTEKYQKHFRPGATHYSQHFLFIFGKYWQRKKLMPCLSLLFYLRVDLNRRNRRKISKNTFNLFEWHFHNNSHFQI